MYTIYADGRLVHEQGAQTLDKAALDVKLCLDVESAGSLSFTLPPGNARYDDIQRMKSIITLVQDGAVIFRGRVLDDEKDFWGQKTVYCEGDMAFLLDSLQENKPRSGNVQDVFKQMINSHNAQVDEKKRFAIGTITAVDADKEMEAAERSTAKSYINTSAAIEQTLLSVHGGYVRTRMENGTAYIDWLKEFAEKSGQIAFAVNLLDLKDRMDASDVFTCLIPLGYSEIDEDGEYKDPVTIADVNGGVDYIQDDAAVALYGKIWRSKTWSDIKEPEKLLEKAREYMASGTALRTLTLTAIDMHFTNGDASMIRTGTKVQITSNPHGLQTEMVCARMDIDPDNPEKTVYTFGIKPRTLSDAVTQTETNVNSMTGGHGGHGGGGSGVQQELEEVLRWARICVDNLNANILLQAGSIDELTGKVSEAQIQLDGLTGTVNVHANEINLIAEDIVNINKMFVGSAKATLIRTANITADGANIDSMSYDGTYVSWKEATFLTSSTSLSITSTGGTVTGVTMNKKTKTIYYLGSSSKDEEEVTVEE